MLIGKSARSDASRFIVVLLVVFAAKQLFTVAAFFPFSGHDELAHYSYVRTLATERRIPELPDLEEWRARLDGGVAPPVDGIPAELYQYCRYTLDWFCEPESPRWASDPPRIVTVPGVGYFPSGYQYVANHPPLYYAILAPLYAATSSLSPLFQQYLFRLAAIPFGIMTVFAAYRSARALFPGDAFLAVTVPVFVAFQPQISYEAAMVNNDIVAIAITSLLLWGMIVGVRDRFPYRLCLALGAGAGLGLITKGTTVAILPVLGLAVLLALGWRDWKGLATRLVAIAAPMLLIAAPWYLFLYRTYGDFSGLARVAELQYWNSPMGSFLELLIDPRFFTDRFNESWGEFGWRLIHLDTALIWLVGIPLLIGVLGLAKYASSTWRVMHGNSVEASAPRSWQVQSILLLAAACALAYLAVIQFGTNFALAQARYSFPVVNAGTLLLMIGWRTLVPARLRPVAQGVVVAALIGLNVYIFAAYVLPFTSTVGEPMVTWSWRG